MVIQFSYVTWFSSVFPLAGLFALLNNVVEIRSDAFKICMSFQRPIGERVRNIGAWQVCACRIQHPWFQVPNGWSTSFTMCPNLLKCQLWGAKTKQYILCTKYCVHCAYTQSSPLWLNSTSCSSSVLDWSMPIKSYQIMIKKFVLTRETFSGYEICRSWNILDNSHSLADEDQWDKLHVQLFISLIKFTRNGRVINISV